MGSLSRLVASVALGVAASAYADDAAPAREDAREVFGFKKKPQEAKPSCEDGRTFGCATATDLLDPTSPALLRTWLTASYLLRLPVADARQLDVAHFAAGASRDDAGPAFAGATGLENAWTIEGAPVENPRNGNVETRVPLTFMTGMLVSAGGFSARDRAGLGGTVDVELRRGGTRHEVEAHAWGALIEQVRSRPIAAATYQLRRVELQPGPEASVSVVATGPLPALGGGRTWYAAGLAGTFGPNELTWRAARLVDVDQDGLPDGLPGVVALEPITTTSLEPVDYLVPYMARAGWTRGPHDVALTLIGQASHDARFLANATLPAAVVDRDTLVADGIATWKGTWRSTRARVLAAWHRTDRAESPRDPAAGTVQRLTAYVPSVLPDEPALAGACSDAPGDPYPLIPNCPVPFGFFASGGAGELVDSVGDRPTVTADVAHRLGRHVLRAGGTFEDTRLVQRARFTGGQLERSLFEGHSDIQRFVNGACGEEPGSPCAYVDAFELTYRTRYTAAYVEDTFSPVPNLRVDTGVRWELMWVGPRLHFSDQIAPRLALAWDVLGNGQSRWWASMGRTHALLPAGMGELAIARPTSVRDVAFNEIRDRRFDAGNVFRIAEDIQPVAQDELATGFEIGVIGAVRLGGWLQRRSLRRGLETVLASGTTGEAVFDNPGRARPLQVPALRETLTAAFDVLIAPSPKLAFRASYLWGQAVGSWTGPFDPRQGAQLYAGTEWDLDATNLYGRLPSDVGHRVAIEGERRGSVGPVDLAVSTRLIVASGRPRDVLGDGDRGLVYLLPRGSVGRMPVLSQANARVTARWRGTDLTLDVFNAFDRTTAVARSEVYADGVTPVVGGSFEDLVFAKTEGCSMEGDCVARTAQRRTAYGLPTQFATPRAFVLGIHRAF